MKKLIFLTSILALSACAGGDGGITGNQQPENNTLTPKESNEKITGIVYNNDDLRLGSSKFGDDNYYYSFELDQNGKITGYKTNYYDDTILHTTLYKRDGDSNSFKNNSRKFYFKPSESNIELLKNSEYSKDITSNTLEELKEKLKKVVGRSSVGQDEKEKVIMQIENLTLGSNEIKELHNTSTTEFYTYGKEAGLKYSDFGYLNENSEQKHNDNVIYDVKSKNMLFFGYEQKEIKKSDIQEQELTFNGKAVGVVENNKLLKNDKDYIHDSDTYKDETLASLDLNGKATLKFNKNNEKETLNMSFSNWYDVKVETDKNRPKITFSNTNNNTIDEKLKFDTDTERSLGVGLTTKYYGDDKTKPSEVIGDVNYYEYNFDTKTNKIFKASFGGVKQ